MNSIKDSKLRNRKNRIFFLYRDYLLADKLNDSKESINGEEYNFSKKQKDFIQKILSKKEILEKEIFPFLPSDWKWERFNTMEKAVLLNAVAEIKMTDIGRVVVINESIEYAKKYCDERAQPLLNAIIDKIKKDEEQIEVEEPKEVKVEEIKEEKTPLD